MKFILFAAAFLAAPIAGFAQVAPSPAAPPPDPVVSGLVETVQKMGEEAGLARANVAVLSARIAATEKARDAATVRAITAEKALADAKAAAADAPK